MEIIYRFQLSFAFYSEEDTLIIAQTKPCNRAKGRSIRNSNLKKFLFEIIPIWIS